MTLTPELRFNEQNLILAAIKFKTSQFFNIFSKYHLSFRIFSARCQIKYFTHKIKNSLGRIKKHEEEFLLTSFLIKREEYYCDFFFCSQLSESLTKALF